MPKGYHDRVAFVDLSRGKVWYEAYGEAFWRRYLGGRALAAYLLLKHVPKGADPLGPGNALVFAPGVLTGSPISGSGRNTVAAKSPLTGGYGDAEGGGFFGAELKNAGLDALVVLGKAESPVYLHVEGGEVAIHPAFHLWGKDPLEVEALIKEVHGASTRIAQIGLAGENGVLTANVIHDLAHFAGRGAWGRSWGPRA
jgi:aldehyde:ferredoxin oxidoreductase